MNKRLNYPENFIKDIKDEAAIWHPYNCDISYDFDNITKESIEKAFQRLLDIESNKKKRDLIHRAITVVKFRYMYKLTYAGIKNIMNISENVAKSDIKKIIKLIISNYDANCAITNKDMSPLSEDTLIAHLNLSTMIKNSLIRCRYKIFTLGDLLNCEFNDLRKIRNLGVKSIQEIAKFVEDNGFEMNKCNDEYPICNSKTCKYRNIKNICTLKEE